MKVQFISSYYGTMKLESKIRSIFDRAIAGQHAMDGNYYVIYEDHKSLEKYALTSDASLDAHDMGRFLVDDEVAEFNGEKVRAMTMEEERLYNMNQLMAHVDLWGNIAVDEEYTCNDESEAEDDATEPLEIEFEAWGKTHKARFWKCEYTLYGNTYIGVVTYNEEYGGWEPWCDLTVNLNSKLEPNKAYLDTNNCSPDIIRILRSKGCIKDTGITKFSGFCEYPLVEFSEKFLSRMFKQREGE